MSFRRASASFGFAVLILAAAATGAFAQDPFKLKPGARGKLCLECHVAFQETMAQPFIHTPVKAGSCSDCHSPHSSSHGKLLAADKSAICSTCHEGLIPEGAASAHAPAESGQCIQCHDPHAAPNKSNLLLAGGKLCGSCHEQIVESAASSKFKHAPVETGCETCHEPHASTASGFLLKQAVPALCTGCHSTTQPGFARQHMNYPVGTAQCTSCHNPHGSNNSGILWANVHAPLVNKMCNQCHNDPGSPQALETKKRGFELCRGCHSEVINEISTKNRVHWPAMDEVACLNCHNPHASPNEALLKKPVKPLCGTCHQDTMARLDRSEVKHAPVDDGSCATCHSPHASDAVFLLQQTDVFELCGTCHDWQTHSTHPIGEKIVDPRNKNLTVDCLSCHRSHGSPFKAFTHKNPNADLCVQCHQEQRR